MQINGNTPVNLTLSVDAVNTLLASLSAQPYERVAGLIDNIKQQATAQLVPPQPDQEPADASS